jgi:hypothetical protein
VELTTRDKQTLTLEGLTIEDVVDLAGMMREHARTMAQVPKWGLDQGHEGWFLAEAHKWEERGLVLQEFVDENFVIASDTDALRYRDAIPDESL